MERLLTSRSTAVESENSDTDGPETERDSITPDSDLAMAGFTLTQIIKDHFSTDLIRLVCVCVCVCVYVCMCVCVCVCVCVCEDCVY